MNIENNEPSNNKKYGTEIRHLHPLRLDSIHGSEVAQPFLRKGFHGEGRHSAYFLLLTNV